MEGSFSHDVRGATTGYLPNSNTQADAGGGTYTGANRQPSIEDYEAIFGPSARDIKQDNGRFKRHQRWHLPDVLKGPNEYLTDRIDGLITDTTQSPFTTTYAPANSTEGDPNPAPAEHKLTAHAAQDLAIRMASRVPYESAARVLAQSHKSFAGYTVRHGLAITMEHNFMVSPEGRTNFQNQLKQLIGSIQYSNDYDVHTALILAPSYAKTIDEKYYQQDKNVWQRCREYVDLFGIMQKNTNALDILIEEARSTLRSWGSQEPSFLLTNPKLTMQMTMTPEKTSYVAHGPEGQKLLKQGPSLPSYRGLNIINSRCFATEEGKRPRDMLDRRVRVAEYYVVSNVPCNDIGQPLHSDDYVELYDQSKDQMFKLTMQQLYEASFLPGDRKTPATGADMHDFLDNTKNKGIKRATARFWERDGDEFKEASGFTDRAPAGASTASAPQTFGFMYGRYGGTAVNVFDGNTPPANDAQTLANRMVTAFTTTATQFPDDTAFFNAISTIGTDKLMLDADSFKENKLLTDQMDSSVYAPDTDAAAVKKSCLYHSPQGPLSSGDLASDKNGAHGFYSYLPMFPEYMEDSTAWGFQSCRPMVYVSVTASHSTIDPNRNVHDVGPARWRQSIENLSGVNMTAAFDTMMKGRDATLEQNAGDLETSTKHQKEASAYLNLQLHLVLLLQTRAWIAEQEDTTEHNADKIDIETKVSPYFWETLSDIGVQRVKAKNEDFEEAEFDVEQYKNYSLNVRVTATPKIQVSMHFLIACICHSIHDDDADDNVAFTKMLGAMQQKSGTALQTIDLGYGATRAMFTKNWKALNEYMTKAKLEIVAKYFSVTTDKLFAQTGTPATATLPVGGGVAGGGGAAGGGDAPGDSASLAGSPPVAPAQGPDYALTADVETLRQRVGTLEAAKIAADARFDTATAESQRLEGLLTSLRDEYDEYTAPSTAAPPAPGAGAPQPAPAEIAALTGRINAAAAKAKAAETAAANAARDVSALTAALTKNKAELEQSIHNEYIRADKAERDEAARASLQEAALRKELGDLKAAVAAMGTPGGRGALPSGSVGAALASSASEHRDFIVVRPCIEHQMLGVVMGRGGKDELGCTFWGQTELSVYDDSMHGKWGMSYKYHERAMVLNERNLVRCWDVAFNGYNGGNDDRIIKFSDAESVNRFRDCVADVSKPYCGDSIMVMSFKHQSLRRYSNPLVFQNPELGSDTIHIDPSNVHAVYDPTMELIEHPADTAYDSEQMASYLRWKDYSELMPPFRQITGSQNGAGHNSHDEVTATSALAFQGTCRVQVSGGGATPRVECQNGSGHLGPSYVGVASVREGKGLFFQPGASGYSFTRPM